MLVQTGTTQADDELGAQRTPPERRVPERPVFVDASGRRQQQVRRLGRILVVPAVAYVGLLVSTLLGGPTINIPFLPLPSAPHSSGSHGTPRTVHHGTSGGANGGGSVAGANGTGTNAGVGTTAGTTAGTGSTAGTGVQASPGTTAGSTGTSAPSALPTVTASPSAVITHGHSTHTATATPGASHRPTKKAIQTAP